MVGAENENDPSVHGRQLGGRSKPPPPSWPRSLAPLVVIFAFSLAVVLAILAFT